MNKPLDRLDREGAARHYISADEFWLMVNGGVFSDRRIDLVEGELIEMAPANKPHARLAGQIAGKLFAAYPEDGWLHFLDVYVTLSPEIVRAPDVVIVNRKDDPAGELSGSDVTLAIEVSHSTLDEDLNRKRPQYAKAGILNYWVVDVTGQRIHRFSAPEGVDYRDREVDDFSHPLPLPGVDTTITID